MKSISKAKWFVGITGAAFSAFVLAQLDEEPAKTSSANMAMMEAGITDSMSEREKELVQLDWSNFTLEQQNQGAGRSDYTTRRS